MKICILSLIIFLACQLGCFSDVITKNEVVSLKITKLSKNKSSEKSIVIKDRAQIYLIANIVNNCHREPMIIPAHFKIEVQYVNRELTIFSVENNIKIDGITYKVGDDLEAMLDKMVK